MKKMMDNESDDEDKLDVYLIIIYRYLMNT